MRMVSQQIWVLNRSFQMKCCKSATLIVLSVLIDLRLPRQVRNSGSRAAQPFRPKRANEYRRPAGEGFRDVSGHRS